MPKCHYVVHFCEMLQIGHKSVLIFIVIQNHYNYFTIDLKSKSEFKNQITTSNHLIFLVNHLLTQIFVENCYKNHCIYHACLSTLLSSAFRSVVLFVIAALLELKPSAA